MNGTDNSETYHQQVVDVQRSIQTERCDYHDERVREIGTICKPTEGIESPKRKKAVDNTCADKEQSILEQRFHSRCTENVDSTTSGIVSHLTF
jgi:hypothetical protein